MPPPAPRAIWNSKRHRAQQAPNNPPMGFDRTPSGTLRPKPIVISPSTNHTHTSPMRGNTRPRPSPCLSDVRIRPTSTTAHLPCLFGTCIRPISTTARSPCLSDTHMHHISTEAHLPCLSYTHIHPISTATRSPCSSDTHIRPASTTAHLPCLFGTRIRPTSIQAHPSYPSDTHIRPTSTPTVVVHRGTVALPPALTEVGTGISEHDTESDGEDRTQRLGAKGP